MDCRPLVAVLLGTDHHAFDRLLLWVGEAARAGGTRWFVQHGSTPLPVGLEGSPMLGVDQLAALLLTADAVVTHGGPGLIMEARAAGHFPVVVPRDPALKEHVDHHQQRFTAHLAAAGLVRVADHPHQFMVEVDAALRAGRRPAPVETASDELSRRFGDMVATLVGTR